MEQTVISLRVPEGQVDDWDKQVEELGHQSRTALIQTAVENYIAKGGSDGEGELAQREAISELQTSVDVLGRELEEIGEDIREVKRQTAGTDEDIQELAHDVLPLLPSVDEDRDPREYEQYQKPLEEYEPAEVEIPVTTDAVLSWLKSDPDVDPSYPLSRGDVVDALEFLEGEYLARSQVIGGQTRWAKEV